MGREQDGAAIVADRVESYLRRHGYPDAQVRSMSPLGGDAHGDLKVYGYGKPLLVLFEAEGQQERVVIRTMSPDPFGHERRADRAYQMVLSFDTFNQIDRHIRALDVGSFSRTGDMYSAADGEFFLVTNYVEGELYAKDLFAAQEQAQATPRDLQRAEALAAYLAKLHRNRVNADAYGRHIRDTVGSGEGIFGLNDAYPADDPIATPQRLQTIELDTVRWRWRLGQRSHRACQTHGDFHPFNILFREGSDFSALDCSRGGVGEPADDVTCMSVNYMFFALNAGGEFTGALRQMWDTFWRVYLARSGDRELLEMVPLYFTWRCLVLVSPLWYPNLSATTRERLLSFCERLLAGAAFNPSQVDSLLA